MVAKVVTKSPLRPVAVSNVAFRNPLTVDPGDLEECVALCCVARLLQPGTLSVVHCADGAQRHAIQSFVHLAIERADNRLVQSIVRDLNGGRIESQYLGSKVIFAETSRAISILATAKDDFVLTLARDAGINQYLHGAEHGFKEIRVGNV